MSRFEIRPKTIKSFFQYPKVRYGSDITVYNSGIITAEGTHERTAIAIDTLGDANRSSSVSLTGVE